MAIGRPLLAALGLAAMVLIGPAGGGQQPAFAQEQGQVPGSALGNQSDPDMWRAIREGDRGTVSIPNRQAGVLIQSEGDNWRAFRNGPLSTYGAWGLLGIVALLALFFVLRGRIRIEEGRSGQTITRFNFFERFTHWLTASCFVILALTGLNMLYGRYLLRPLIGPDAFSHADPRRQVRAQLPRLRLHARPGPDVRALDRPEPPEPLRFHLARQGRRHVQEAACIRRPRSSTPARRSSSGW